jgi:lysophospholipase L1-like esterase
MSHLRWAAAAAFLLIPMVAELLARWGIRHRNRYYVFPPGLRLLLHPHPAVSTRLESSVRFEVNSEGERGGEVPRLSSGERLYRALVVGGSQPEGYLLDQDTSWPGALQGMLRTPQNRMRLGASKVHVGSIARSGIDSQALSLILERVLPRYDRLQAIIVLVGASDVLRWLDQGAPPSAPAPAASSELFRCHPELPFGWAPRQLALVESIRRLRRRWLRPLEVHVGTGEWIRKARAMRAGAKVLRTTMPDAGPMLDNFAHHFARILRKAGAHADRVLVVRQPWFDRECTPEEAAQMWHGGVGQAWREEVTTFYALDVLSRLMALVDAQAVRVAQDLGIEHVDLRPILEPSIENYYDFFHATPAAARLVATAVAMALVRQPLPSVKPSDRPIRVSA